MTGRLYIQCIKPCKEGGGKGGGRKGREGRWGGRGGGGGGRKGGEGVEGKGWKGSKGVAEGGREGRGWKGREGKEWGGREGRGGRGRKGGEGVGEGEGWERGERRRGVRGEVGGGEEGGKRAKRGRCQVILVSRFPLLYYATINSPTGHWSSSIATNGKSDDVMQSGMPSHVTVSVKQRPLSVGHGITFAAQPTKDHAYSSMQVLFCMFCMLPTLVPASSLLIKLVYTKARKTIELAHPAWQGVCMFIASIVPQLGGYKTPTNMDDIRRIETSLFDSIASQ